MVKAGGAAVPWCIVCLHILCMCSNWGEALWVKEGSLWGPGLTWRLTSSSGMSILMESIHGLRSRREEAFRVH